jgi:sugar O-acyltransferase (sialic acid O-acetyltransferase NeuD family)
MQRLVIAGAGGFGREVLAWALDAWRVGEPGSGWKFGCFLDDNPRALEPWLPAGVASDLAGGHATAVTGIDVYEPQPEDRVVVAIGTPALRRAVVARLRARGAVFATLIHPTAVIGPRVEIGPGCVICPRVVLTCDLRLGEFVCLNISCAVGHDASIGAYTQASSFCDFTGGVRVGEEVFLGSRASILPRQVVEDRAVIGAGSVVVRRVRAGTTVVGIPARELPV